MEKQKKLNQFLIDLGQFVEKYYSSPVVKVNLEQKEEYVLLSLLGEEDSLLEISSEDEELILAFGESHWHIDDYSDPCDFENIYENTIDSLLEILTLKLGTYSCSKEGVCVGGCSFYVNQEIVSDNAKEIFSDFDEIKVKKWGQKEETYRFVEGELAHD